MNGPHRIVLIRRSPVKDLDDRWRWSCNGSRRSRAWPMFLPPRIVARLYAHTDDEGLTVSGRWLRDHGRLGDIDQPKGDPEPATP